VPEIQRMCDDGLLEQYVQLKLSQSPLKLKSAASRGRGLFTSLSPIESGNVVHEETPLCVIAISPSFCDNCRVSIPRGRRCICSSCECVVCCVNCAATAYLEYHQSCGECEVFCRINQMQTQTGKHKHQFWLRFAARAFIKAASLGSWKLLLGLACPDTTDGAGAESTDKDDAFVLHSAIMSTYFPNDTDNTQYLTPSVQDIFTVLVSLGNNAIALHSDVEHPGHLQQPDVIEEYRYETTAWAIFLVGAMINHSCQPNAYWTFSSDGTMTVYSMEVIPRDVEVEVSYLPGFILNRQIPRLVDNNNNHEEDEDDGTASKKTKVSGVCDVHETKKGKEVREYNLRSCGFGFSCICRLCIS
jgi:hypothetical protein